MVRKDCAGLHQRVDQPLQHHHAMAAAYHEGVAGVRENAPIGSRAMYWKSSTQFASAPDVRQALRAQKFEMRKVVE